MLSKGRLIFAGALLVAGYFTYTALVGAYRNDELAAEEAALRDEVDALVDQRLYVQAVLDYVATDEFVEREARARLGYARPGEIPFVVVSPPATENDDGEQREWWERLFPR